MPIDPEALEALIAEAERAEAWKSTPGSPDGGGAPPRPQGWGPKGWWRGGWKRAWGRPPTEEELIVGPWPGSLHSTYFVSVLGDVPIFRSLVPYLAGKNVGLAFNVDGLALPSMARLCRLALESMVPVYVDSGVIGRARKGEVAPDWRAVFGIYQQCLDMAPVPELLSITAPDVLERPAGAHSLVGNERATRDIQRRHERSIRRLGSAGVRVVVPTQARSDSELFDSFRWILERFDRAYVGVPMRHDNTTPILPLVTAFLRFGRMQVDAGRTDELLPRLHLLGIGSGVRIARQAAQLSALYRVLSGPHVYEILRGRQVERQGPLFALMRRHGMSEEVVAAYLVEASVDELEQLAGCVQTRAYFPCPPGARDTFGESHPIVNDMLRTEWLEHVGSLDLPLSAILARNPVLAEHVLPASEVRFPDRLTQRILGRDDIVVSWYSFHEDVAGGDWTDDCYDVLEEAERTDPCMVPGAWDVEDLDLLVKHGGLDRLQTDATTVPLTAGNGRWILDGEQKRGTPQWWKDRPKSYRVAWNLRAMVQDRIWRESRVRYAFPDDYDVRGFTWTPLASATGA